MASLTAAAALAVAMTLYAHEGHDLKPGMRVVVDTKMDGDKTTATQVRIGSTTTAATPPANQHH